MNGFKTKDTPSGEEMYVDFDKFNKLDEIMSKVAMISLGCFPAILLEHIWLDLLPSKKIFITNIIVFITTFFYCRIVFYEKRKIDGEIVYKEKYLTKINES